MIICKINESVDKINKLVIHVYQFLRLWILKYHNNNIPEINENLVRQIFRVLTYKGKPSSGKRLSKTNMNIFNELNIFFKDHYSKLYFVEQLDKKTLGQIISYQITEIVTNIENNIKLHFVDHMKRFLDLHLYHLELLEESDIISKISNYKNKISHYETTQNTINNLIYDKKINIEKIENIKMIREPQDKFINKLNDKNNAIDIKLKNIVKEYEINYITLKNKLCYYEKKYSTCIKGIPKLSKEELASRKKKIRSEVKKMCKDLTGEIKVTKKIFEKEKEEQINFYKQSFENIIISLSENSKTIKQFKKNPNNLKLIEELYSNKISESTNDSIEISFIKLLVRKDKMLHKKQEMAADKINQLRKNTYVIF